MRCLICIHGLLSNRSDFNFLVPKLMKYYDYIYNFDMPGHGDNEKKFNTKEVKQFYLDVYDKLSLKYDDIDILGYSLGAVIAAYLDNKRKVDNLILLAPGYKYLNLKNYHPSKNNTKISGVFPKRNILYLIKFCKIVSDLSKEINIIEAKTLIIWGKDDYLVKESSGKYLYSITVNKNKMYYVLNNINHFNIVFSDEVLKIIIKFLNN